MGDDYPTKATAGGLARLLSVGLAVMLTLGGCAALSDDPALPPPDKSDRRAVQAPIEEVELLTRETDPPQYALRVVSGLPNGCAALDRVSLDRGEQTFEVMVWNTLPAAAEKACTMVYTTTENIVALGSNLNAGTRYRVRVNGEQRLEFTAQ